MSSSGSITKLIQRVKAGDGAAAQVLFARIFRRLLGLARTRLKGKSLGVADEEDVVQSALLGFFLGAERGQYTQCQDRDDLWHLLAKIIAHKANKLYKYEEAQKRQQRRGEAGIASPGAGETPQPDTGLGKLAAPNLSPDLELLAREQIERLLARLGNAQLVSIAVWKWEGYSNEEIASMLGLSARTIQRKLQLIRAIWSEEEPL